MICDTYPSSTQTDIENKFANHFSKLTFSQIDVDAERARIRLFCEESRAQWQVVKKQRALQELERKGKRRRECGMVTEDICEDRGEVADCDFVLLHSGEGMGQPRADVQENCCDKTITTVDAEDGLSLSSESEAEEIEGGKMVDVTISKQSLQRETSAATRTTDCRDKENFTAGRKSPSREDLLERILRQRSLLAVEVSRPSFDSCSDDGGDQSAIDSSSNGSPDESAMASCDMGTKRSNVVMLSPVQHGGGSSNACRAEWSSSSRQNAGPEIQCIEPHRFYNT
ncbi:unnamed protein product [Symbiodinium microadriaticum]|nr:unnamed protein product [Symbiodinium microadriaticum]